MPQSPSSRRSASPSEFRNAKTLEAATTTTKRQIAGLDSRERLRRDQERKLRQLPFLYRRVQDLQNTCEQLEQELASSHQQVSAFQQEAFALRSLIKLAEHSELAAAAEEKAVECVLQEEVTGLRCRVQRLQREKELSLCQSEEACEAAEFYKQLYDHLCDRLYEESMRGVEASAEGAPTSGVESLERPMPNRRVDISRLATSPVASGRTCTEEQMTQLHGVFEFERARSSALERASALQAAMAKATAADTKRAAAAPNNSAKSSERHREDPTSGVDVSQRRALADDTHSRASRLKRLVAVLRSENRLLTQQVAELVARNMRCIKDIAALKLANKRLELQRRSGS
ncbi:hypothetical protein LSCM1_01146 [Leishmania martiniquensis]|uniref:Uncharacterized protein n=1 Tax=Leishmania martiniquensis TaxID=1580590 RepID=A0A836GNA0_9TRYP|nr:hypothetical protein LSCM1_01146 [Leishmania martiniquensis]